MNFRQKSIMKGHIREEEAKLDNRMREVERTRTIYEKAKQDYELAVVLANNTRDTIKELREGVD